MVIFALVSLFTIQLISIFVIVILYSKVAKFKELEVRHDRLVREMDDAIGAYLLEMREENDRLILELRAASAQPAFATQPVYIPPTEPVQPEVNQQTVEALLTEARTVVPKTLVTSVYNKHKEHQQQAEQALVSKVERQEETPKELPTFEQQVLAYHTSGLSIEDIAKKTQRGKTEIELLIKFHA
ncbi:MAG: hypothetical protein ABS948_02720 [Solibacillus sp.]